MSAVCVRKLYSSTGFSVHNIVCVYHLSQSVRGLVSNLIIDTLIKISMCQGGKPDTGNHLILV